MKNILIYKSEGNLCVTHFAKNLNANQIRQRAENLLPLGTLYRIGTVDELPEDRTFRDAWDLEDADFNGIAGRISTQNSFDRESNNFESLQAQLQHAQQHLSEIEQSINQTQQKINQLESAQEVSSLSFSDADLNSEVSSLSFSDANRKELEDLNDQVESSQSSFESQQNYVNDLNIHIKKSSDELERLQQLLDELEEKFPSSPANESTDDQN